MSQQAPQQWFLSQDCPTRPILEQIADRWSMMTVAVLVEPIRFNEIKGVSQE